MTTHILGMQYGPKKESTVQKLTDKIDRASDEREHRTTRQCKGRKLGVRPRDCRGRSGHPVEGVGSGSGVTLA